MVPLGTRLRLKRWSMRNTKPAQKAEDEKMYQTAAISLLNRAMAMVGIISGKAGHGGYEHSEKW